MPQTFGNIKKLTLRDPEGALYQFSGRYIRAIHPHCEEQIRLILSRQSIESLIENRQAIRFREIEKAKLNSMDFDSNYLLEHPAISFPSYPCEWAPEMLRAAGLLTLDICELLLKDGLGLKDATPFNVLFDGPNPIHVDTLSFETREPNNPLWAPFSQFMETFVNPLIVCRLTHLGLGDVTFHRSQSLSANEALKYIKGFRRFSPLVISNLIIPSLLTRFLKGRMVPSESRCHPLQARFILRALFRRLRQTLEKVSFESKSRWSEYSENPESYTKAQLEFKRDWVRTVLGKIESKKVLDVGCNTGEFSILASEVGAAVTACDSDSSVVNTLWKRARKGSYNILPLVVDFANPTPAGGWKNSQTSSFLDRCKNASFDTVMTFALLHHLIVQEGIPLDEIVTLVKELTEKHWLVELVLPSDPMFKRLARGRHFTLSQSEFETKIKNGFCIQEQLNIPGTFRHLYWLRKI